MKGKLDRDGGDSIVAVGLLTRREVALFGAQLSRLYPLDDASPFADLIEAIDRADRQNRRPDGEG